LALRMIFVWLMASIPNKWANQYAKQNQGSFTHL
jgi:hypothetical protein